MVDGLLGHSGVTRGDRSTYGVDRGLVQYAFLRLRAASCVVVGVRSLPRTELARFLFDSVCLGCRVPCVVVDVVSPIVAPTDAPSTNPPSCFGASESQQTPYRYGTVVG